MHITGLPGYLFTHDKLEAYGNANFLKGGLVYADWVTTVSPTYSEEIKTAFFGEGLNGLLTARGEQLSGILNGIDVDAYNCATDKALFANYSTEDLSRKQVCKTELQKLLGLPVKDVPIIAMITRLVSHKGLDLVKTVAEDILHEDIQFILLGTGDSAYEEYFRSLGNSYEGKMSANIAFNGDLSKKIYSGSDIFLMPSVSEPCGLSQMIASRYATVPVVRETGGLYDSIKPYGAGGNGFTFASCNPYDMLYVVHEALDLYKNTEAWTALMKKAATTDFSWSRSAEDYKKVQDALGMDIENLRIRDKLIVECPDFMHQCGLSQIDFGNLFLDQKQVILHLNSSYEDSFLPPKAYHQYHKQDHK